MTIQETRVEDVPRIVAGAPRHHVSFVLPAYNEEANIVRAVESTALMAEQCCDDYEIIVVDDGSTDRTAALVATLARRDKHIRLAQHETNFGYGEALHTGFASAQGEFVFFTDADNQFDINEFPLLLAWANEADCVAGYRAQRRDPLSRRMNAWLWNRLVRMLFYVPVRDIDCAFKLFRRSALTAMTIESRGAMVNTEIMVKLARAGRSIVEVPVTHLPRTAGTASGANVRVVTRAFREMTQMYSRLSRYTPALTTLDSSIGS